MLFSTKAEYGVRLMVELGRRAGDDPDRAEPVALAAVAEAELLPLSYLEHLVAKLRQADLVTSVRGAHGGYRLAKPAAEIGMLDVVEVSALVTPPCTRVQSSFVAQAWPSSTSCEHSTLPSRSG